MIVDIAIVAVLVLVLLTRYVGPPLVRRFTGWTTINVSVSRPDANELAAVAARRNVTVDVVVRQAIDRELAYVEMETDQT